MGMQISSSSSFLPANERTIELLRRFNEEQHCTFLTSSNYMHAETAKLGYLLSSLLAEGGVSGDCRTFFVNSGLEALSGAIKLARQSSVRNRRPDEGWVLFIDPEHKFEPFFDATGKGVEGGLTPHIDFVDTLAEAAARVRQRSWSALVIIRRAQEPDGQEVVDLVANARRSGALVISCDCELPLSDPVFLVRRFQPDVVVFGENLTDRQLPFGCFTMTERAHQVWNNDVDCFAQTSTFGGNKVCAAAALLAMDMHNLVSEAHRTTFGKIDDDFRVACTYWGRYVNPGMAALAGIFGMDMEVVRAYGGRLLLADGREVIDCSGGFGSNLRGHNPPDLPSVLASHDRERDYFAELEDLLGTLTKFPHVFPAVSGATAVDSPRLWECWRVRSAAR
jgi:adenosylmethionine-8-amino-7-oxononanoate aminotransferase